MSRATLILDCIPTCSVTANAGRFARAACGVSCRPQATEPVSVEAGGNEVGSACLQPVPRGRLTPVCRPAVLDGVVGHARGGVRALARLIRGRCLSFRHRGPASSPETWLSTQLRPPIQRSIDLDDLCQCPACLTGSAEQLEPEDAVRQNVVASPGSVALALSIASGVGFMIWNTPHRFQHKSSCGVNR